MSKPETNRKCRLGISIGDYNGIGLEVIMKTLSDNRIMQFCTPVIYGSTRILSYYKKVLGFNNFNYTSVKDFKNLNSKVINVVNCWNSEVSINIGEPTFESGKFAKVSLGHAAQDLKENKIDALVTAPLSKSNVSTEEAKFTGHTEYLEEVFGKSSLMFMCHERIKIGLVTNHFPVREIAENISTEQILKKLRVMNTTLNVDFGIKKPRIAVLGLNPHAGDEGLLGSEEAEFIAPALRQAKNEKILALGPFSADGFFAKGHEKKFDAVLAMFHDQGLIPFKMIAGGNGVNFTAGLPAVRTSPDHGTAFDIAGKGKASEDSFRASMFMAIDIWKNRLEHKELTATALVN